MWRKRRAWIGLAILLGTGGCGIGLTERPAVVSDYCRIAGPIAYDTERDSTETVAAIEAHNSRYVCLCEGDCPKTGAD